MADELARIDAAIAALEGQRALLGDAVVDTALDGLRAQRAATFDAATSDDGQSLRMVTVLFLDVVGSTALAGKLDPEDVSAVMDTLLARATAIVEAHAGKVLQYAGDSLLAVFGAEASAEDDAERAVRAGLALLDEAAQQREAVRLRHGHDDFDIRVGVHTGDVLLGGGIDADGNVRGVTVHVAARMEQTAPAGALRISHETLLHVRGVFDVEPQPPIEVKGVVAPVVTYLVHRARPRGLRSTARGIEGVATRMIGRAAELARLQQAFERVVHERRLACVTIVAEAGIGKSRLLHEFQAWLDSGGGRAELFQGRAHPQMRQQPFGLLRDLLATRFGILDGDSPASAKQVFEAGMAALPGDGDGDAPAHLLGHLIGLDFADSPHVQAIAGDGRQLRSRAFHAVASLLRRLAQRGPSPLLMLLDDLHCADDASLDFVRHIIDVERDLPLLIVGLARPELFVRDPDWPAAAPGTDAQRIDLQPLAPSLSHALADELLQKLPQVPDALRELISASAEGNPFYMEELVKMLVDDGAIEVGPDGWRLNAGTLQLPHVPQTLTGVLQARLDAAGPAEKRALQQAAVIGFVFWDGALAAIDANATATLPDATQRALVVPHPDGGFAGAREFAFSHQLLHQVAYDTVLKRLRRSYHLKAGEWLASQAGARANDFLGATAAHFEQGGDRERAAEYYARAAAYAESRYAQDAAIAAASRGLALLDTAEAGTASPTLADTRWRLLCARESSLGLQGRRDEQRADVAALEALAEAGDDDHWRFEAAWRRADIALRTADYRGLEIAARRALAFGERVGDESMRLRAQQRLAIALSQIGEIDAGKALVTQALAAARHADLPRIESLCLNLLCIIASTQDDTTTALAIDREKLLLDAEIGNPLNLAVTIANHGESWLQVGDHERATEFLGEGLRRLRELGDRSMQSLVLLNLSQLELRGGDALAAEARAHEALAIARLVQSPEYEARAEWAGAQAACALGRFAAAASGFERAAAIGRAADLEPCVLDATAGTAKVALARGDLPAALQAVEALMAHLARGGNFEGTDGPRLISLACIEVLGRAGDPRAGALLRTTHAELQARAAAITESALRDSYLHRIPEHAALLALWAAAQGAGAGG